MLKAQERLSGLPLTHDFTTEDYGGGIQNWDFHQDAYGLLYVANNFGLLVFDGESWEQVSLDYNTRTLAVHVTSDQRIFVGGQGSFGYLNPVSPDSLSYISLKEQLPKAYQNFDEVWNIHAVGEEIIFCTLEHLFAFDGSNLRVIDPQVSLGLSFMVNGQLYVAAKGEGLLRLESDGLSLVHGSDRFADMDIRGVVPYDGEHLLVATRDTGLYLLNNQSAERWMPGIATDDKLQINTMKILRNGYFSIGTQNRGLLIINREGKVIHGLEKRHGLPSSTVLTLLEDRLGNLWAGLNNGISYVEIDRSFTLINDDMGLPGTGYAALLHDDMLYLGTSNGLFVMDTKNQPTDSDPDLQFVEGTSGQVYNLQLLDGRLWMAHHRGGFLINGRNSQRIAGFEGAWKFLQTPTMDKVLAGTYNGMVLLQKENGKWSFVKKLAGFGESSRKFEMDDQGEIWISHGYKGVFRLTFNNTYDSLLQTSYYGAEDGFPSNLLINVYRVRGQLLFAAEQGIYRYSREKDRFIPDAHLSSYFGADHVRELEEDILGNLYFITDREAGVLRKISPDSYEKETRAFNKIYSLISDDLENITSISQDVLLMDAKEGFVLYDQRKSRSRPETFNTLIRSVQWNDSTLVNGFYSKKGYKELQAGFGEDIAVLPYGKNSLYFRFSSTFFEGMQHNRYRYRLEGYDTQWSDWTDQTSKEYTNLPEGSYTFLVQAKNIYGQESAGMEYSFLITPPWYRRQWAYSVFFLSFIMILGTTFTLLDFRYKKKSRAIEDNARNVLGEKDAELKAVTQKSEMEISKLQNERLALEIKHKNSELASSAMHLINKNEFMNTIKVGIKDLIRDGEVHNSSTAKGLKRLAKDIERNIAEDENWDRFEMHFDQVHGDFIKKMKGKFPDLTPQELKLSAFLRMNMSSKEIAHLLNITVRGVEISRYRLRKKLPLERNDNLVEYMMKI